jgi:hypothetical protein
MSTRGMTIGGSALPAPTRRGRGKAQKSLDLIDAAYRILSEIQPASVRAVCYRLFTEGWIDGMDKKYTNRVGTQLTWAREQGLIPWAWIVDGTREIERPTTWHNPGQLLRACARQYRQDWWLQQDVQLLLCSEKSTVEGTVKPITDQYCVGFPSLHGYSSATSAHDVATLSMYSTRPLILLYIGDWDPSGMHMSERDLPDRLERYGGEAEVKRIALTEYDIGDELASFSAETKRKDPRYRSYVERYGRRCWELDALNPNVLRSRVEGAIREYIDWEEWERCKRVEEAERASILEVVGAWNGGRQ